MNEVIRPACPDDAQALHALNEAFNGPTGVTPEQIRRSLAACPELVAIALVAGVPAGFCCAQMHASFCYPAPVAEITELYVAPAYRRQGLGLKLLAYTEALASSRGATECHLLTGVGNHAAQALYRAAGYERKDEAYLRKKLREKPVES